MKNLLFAIALLFSLTGYSQELTLENPISKEIKYEKGKFYVNGSQIASYEVRQLFVTDVRATTLFKKAKAKEGLGGMFLGLGVTLTVVDLAIGLFSDARYPTALTYVGLGSVALSLPILSGRSKKIEAAVKSYNDGLKTTSSFYDNYEVAALANGNGVGFQIKF